MFPTILTRFLSCARSSGSLRTASPSMTFTSESQRRARSSVARLLSRSMSVRFAPARRAASRSGNVGAPLLALLLVAVLGMAVRYVPENADGALSTRVAQNPEPPRPSASTLFGGPEPLRRISELDLSALVPLAEDALPFSTSTLRDPEA